MQENGFRYSRGEVYIADLGETNFGSIQRGMRPVVILQNEIGNSEAPTLIVVPLSTKIKRIWLPVHVILPKTIGLDEDSIALCEQITTIDKKQICRFVGKLNSYYLKKVIRAVLISIAVLPVEQKSDSIVEGPNDMILTLCQQHKQQYLDNPEYRVRRVDHFQDREECALCNGFGYDYKITHFSNTKGKKQEERKWT